jgi:N-acetylglucosaminyl-diphospho-decaprenol L-rhamnosyltransferase
MVALSVIIVTFNNEEDIADCLDSLLQEESPRKEIIVVDNNSQDRTRGILADYRQDVRVFYLKENLGYARANNIGYSNACGRYIFLLNPDTKIIPGCVSTMFSFMEKNRGVIALAPHVINPDGTTQSSIRRFPDFLILFFELCGLSRLFAESSIFNRWRVPDFNYNAKNEVEQPMASAFLVRKSFFTEQFMDEQFEIFFNDVDLCKRIKNRDGKIVYFPHATVIHKRGASIKKVKEKMIPLHSKGLIKYFAKHKVSFGNRILLLFFVPAIILNTILRIIILRFFSKEGY